MKIKILIFLSIFLGFVLADSAFANRDVHHNHKSRISPFDSDLDGKKAHCLLNKSHHFLHCLLKKGSQNTPSLHSYCGNSPFSKGAQQTNFQKNFAQIFFENSKLPKPNDSPQSFVLDFQSYRSILGTPPIPPPRLS